MKKEVMNKKGQDLSIGTLILIVLGIVVLVLLIMGFSLGWSNLWEKINIFGGGSSLSTIATGCNIAATQGDKIRYCQEFQSIKVNGKIEYYNCEDRRLLENIDSPLTCNRQNVNSAKRAVCNSIDPSKIADTTIFTNIPGGETCSTVLGTAGTPIEKGCQISDFCKDIDTKPDCNNAPNAESCIWNE